MAANTGNPALYLLAAQTYLANRDRPAAEEALKQALELEPAYLEGYQLLTRLYLAEGRLDDARRELERAAERQPTDATALTTIGIIYEAQGEPELAERAYRSALQRSERAAVAANNLAWMIASAGGDLGEALELAYSAKRVSSHPAFSDTSSWSATFAGCSTRRPFIAKGTGRPGRSSGSRESALRRNGCAG